MIVVIAVCLCMHRIMLSGLHAALRYSQYPQAHTALWLGVKDPKTRRQYIVMAVSLLPNVIRRNQTEHASTTRAETQYFNATYDRNDACTHGLAHEGALGRSTADMFMVDGTTAQGLGVRLPTFGTLCRRPQKCRVRYRCICEEFGVILLEQVYTFRRRLAPDD